MKIAVAYEDEEVALNFDITRFFKIYESEDSPTDFTSRIIKTGFLGYIGLVDFLVKEDITALICKHISPGAKEHLEKAGIRCYNNVYGFPDDLAYGIFVQEFALRLNMTFDQYIDAFYSGPSI